MKVDDMPVEGTYLGPNGDSGTYGIARIPFKSMEQEFIERVEKLEKMLNELYYPYRKDKP